MSRGFTGRTKRQVHDIKRRYGIRRQEFRETKRTVHWVCQDPVNMGRHEVAGSEAAGKRAGSIILWLWLWDDQYILL
jgi:hypothetical protein